MTNQQNSEATVGVEVPEEAVEAVEQAIYNRGDIHPDGMDMRLVTTADAERVAAAAYSEIAPAIRTEEREKVLGTLTGPEAKKAALLAYQDAGATPWPQAMDAALAAVVAALRSLPVGAMEEPLRWKVGQILRHPIGSTWKLVDQLERELASVGITMKVPVVDAQEKRAFGDDRPSTGGGS